MKQVDPATLKKWLENQEAVLIDVREHAEHENENIAEAILKPLSQFDAQALSALKDKKVVVHCQLGKRGQQACDMIRDRFPDMDVYNLEGGLVAWQQANLPTQSTASAHLPLNQQVQVTVGSFVLAGSFLAYAVSAGFIIIPAFFGAGLIFTGLTGNCIMARILAKMPWNQ